MTDSGMDAVSAYSERAGSTRVRLYDWFAHVGVTPRRHVYAGNADNQPRTLLRSLPKVIKAELDLRLLPRQLRDRTVIMSKQASPFSSGGIEERLLTSAARSVYDFDDALYAEDAMRATSRLWSRAALWRRAVSAADVVIAGNERLADEASRWSDSVVIVPSCIEPDDYERKRDYDIHDAPRAVWIGSPASESYLSTIAEPLLHLNRTLGLRLTVVSGAGGALGELEAIIDRQPWSLESFGSALASGDVGIMPLPDNEFTRGKCAYKLLQYAAAGLPAVGSPVGANQKALEVTGGLAATTSEDWIGAISQLVSTSSARRAALGSAAIDGVVANYSFAAWSSRWLQHVGLEA